MKLKIDKESDASRADRPRLPKYSILFLLGHPLSQCHKPPNVRFQSIQIKILH